MSALTVGTWPIRVDTEPHGYRSFSPGNAQFYSGQMVMYDTADKTVKPVSGSAGNTVVVGIVDHQDVLVSPSAPLPEVQLRTQFGTFGMNAQDSVSGSLPGTLMYAVDDQTVSNLSTGGRPIAGRLWKFNSSDAKPAYVTLGSLAAVSGSTI